MKLRNVRNGQIATVIEHDDKCKTTMLELENGETKVLSNTTVKRWWREIKDDTVKEPETEAEEVAGDGTPYKQVMEEIIQDEKKVKAAKSKSEKATNPEVPGIAEFIDTVAKKAGMNFYIRDKQPNFKNYRFDEGKVQFTVRIVKHQVEVNCKSRDIKTKVASRMAKMNGFYDMKFSIKALDDDSKKVVTDIIANYKKEEK